MPRRRVRDDALDRLLIILQDALEPELVEESRYFIGPKKRDIPKRKRKLSAWNKYVKANSKKPRFRLRSGSPNLKKLAVAFRKTPAGKKKRR